MSRQLAIIDRDLKIIQGDGLKSVSEINERAYADTLKIKSESELKAAEIRAQTLILQSKMTAEGEAEARLTTAKAEGACQRIEAEQQSIVAQKNADSLKIEGQGEADLKAVLGLRRLYQYLNTKLEVIKQMSYNPNLKIFGKSDDTNLAQLAAYSIINNNARI